MVKETNYFRGKVNFERTHSFINLGLRSYITYIGQILGNDYPNIPEKSVLVRPVKVSDAEYLIRIFEPASFLKAPENVKKNYLKCVDLILKNYPNEAIIFFKASQKYALIDQEDFEATNQALLYCVLPYLDIKKKFLHKRKSHFPDSEITPVQFLLWQESYEIERNKKMVLNSYAKDKEALIEFEQQIKEEINAYPVLLELRFARDFLEEIGEALVLLEKESLLNQIPKRKINKANKKSKTIKI